MHIRWYGQSAFLLAGRENRLHPRVWWAHRACDRQRVDVERLLGADGNPRIVLLAPTLKRAKDPTECA
jgi:hypothetical protein